MGVEKEGILEITNSIPYFKDPVVPLYNFQASKKGQRLMNEALEDLKKVNLDLNVIGTY